MRWLKMVSGVPLLGLGCGVAPSEPTGQPRSAQVEPLDELAVRPPSRGKVRGGEAMRRQVKWPQADARVLAAYDDLDGPSREAVDEAPVPVLVPALDLRLDRRRVMHGPEWAAFWGQRPGLTVSLHASRMARVFQGVKPKPGTHTVRGREGFITRNEGIWSATWIEHGVAYALELECVPLDAPQCSTTATLEEVAEGLVYVGGQGSEGSR